MIIEASHDGDMPPTICGPKRTGEDQPPVEVTQSIISLEAMEADSMAEDRHQLSTGGSLEATDSIEGDQKDPVVVQITGENPAGHLATTLDDLEAIEDNGADPAPPLALGTMMTHFTMEVTGMYWNHIIMSSMDL